VAIKSRGVMPPSWDAGGGQPGGGGDGLQTVWRSAADLRREQETQRVQLARLQARTATSKRLVEKWRRRGGRRPVLEKYVTDRRTMSSAYGTSSTGRPRKRIRALPATLDLEAIEGSDTLEMMTISAGTKALSRT